MSRKKNKVKQIRNKSKLDTAMNMVNSLIENNYEVKTARSIGDWINEKGFMTEKQFKYLKRLKVAQRRGEKIGKILSGEKKIPIKYCYCYAISDGEFVKFGFSHNPRRRLNELQTTNPRYLNLLWSKSFDNAVLARNYESLIHSKFREQRKAGEWFNLDCFEELKENNFDAELIR